METANKQNITILVDLDVNRVVKHDICDVINLAFIRTKRALGHLQTVPPLAMRGIICAVAYL